MGNLSTFGDVQVLDLTSTDSDLKGFAGGFSDGTNGYLVPYDNGASQGKVARFNLNTFGDVQVLDLTATWGDLKSFAGGFSDGTYGYLVPYRKQGAPLGKVARFTLSTFGGMVTTTTSLGTTISTIPAMTDYDDHAQVPKKPTIGASNNFHNSQSSQRCTLQATIRRVVFTKRDIAPRRASQSGVVWCLALHFLAMSRSEVCSGM